MLWAREGDAQGGGRAGRSSHPASFPGRAQGRGVAGARLGDPRRRVAEEAGDTAREWSPGCRSLWLIVASSALNMERPCLEPGCAAHRLRRASQMLSPRRPARPSLPGRIRGQPDAGSGARPSHRLGKQRRGRGGIALLFYR